MLLSKEYIGIGSNGYWDWMGAIVVFQFLSILSCDYLDRLFVLYDGGACGHFLLVVVLRLWVLDGERAPQAGIPWAGPPLTSLGKGWLHTTRQQMIDVKYPKEKCGVCGLFFFKLNICAFNCTKWSRSALFPFQYLGGGIMCSCALGIWC